MFCILCVQHSIGGRVTVIQTCLPTTGPGALKNRDVNPPATKKVCKYIVIRRYK